MKKFLTSLLLSSAVFANSDYNLIFDPYFSPYVGADNLLLTHDLIEKSKVGQFTHIYSQQQNDYSKLFRAAELIFAWDPFNYVTMVTQHEIFGHGYRVRSLTSNKAKVLSYHIGIPRPYGSGGGGTHYQTDNTQVTAPEFLAIYSGGIEATAIFANKVRMNWLEQSKINPWQSTLYLFSEHDITNYSFRSTESAGDDIADYIYVINHTFEKAKLSVKDLKKSALINFLDPFTFYSGYGWFTYVKKGKIVTPPMITLGSYQYLPSLRFGLTPYGPEYYLENFFVKDNKPIYVYLRGSNFAGMSSQGIGIECPQLIKVASWPIGFRLDLWHQPNIDYSNLSYAVAHLADGNKLNLDIRDSRMGVSASLIVQTKLFKHGALFVQLGAKTAGYVPGESLNASPIARLGITFW